MYLDLTRPSKGEGVLGRRLRLIFVFVPELDF
jgi:hypothetical protein